MIYLSMQSLHNGPMRSGMYNPDSHSEHHWRSEWQSGMYSPDLIGPLRSDCMDKYITGEDGMGMDYMLLVAECPRPS